MSSSETLPKRLASYRLGLLSRTYDMWKQLFQEHPEWEWGTADGVLLAVEQLIEAVTTLAKEIHPNVYSDLRHTLRDLHDNWRRVGSSLLRAYLAEDSAVRPADEIAAAMADPVVPVMKLTDLAVGDLSKKRWCELGLRVGHQLLEIQSLIDHHAANPRAVAPSTPAAAFLVDAARAIPRGDRFHVPLLKSLCARGRDLRTTLSRVLRSKRFNGYDSSMDLYVASQLLMEFDQKLQEELRAYNDESDVGQPVRQSSVLEERPPEPVIKWDSITGELRVNGKVARVVKPSATRVIPILDKFQELNWPPQIEDPFLEGDKRDVSVPTNRDPQRLHEAIRSLNDGIKKNLIVFQGDGTGKGIKYRLS